MVCSKFAFIVQILGTIGLLVSLVLWANGLGDISLPTPSCPQGVTLRESLEMRHQCTVEREQIYFPQWARPLFPISAVSMFVGLIMVISCSLYLRKQEEVESTQKKILRTSLIVFGVTFFLCAFIVTLPIVVAVWVPGPEPIY